MHSGMIVLLAGIFIVSGCRPAQKTSSHSFAAELAALTNLSTFSEADQPPILFISSYDRTGGNNDFLDVKGFKPGEPITIADLKGPGCVKRLWMTGIPGEVLISFYFDNESTPRYQLLQEDLFGKTSPFLTPLAQELSGAKHSYVPILYKKALKITLSTPPEWKDPRPYVQINYEPYDRADFTSLPPSAQLSPSDRQCLSETSIAWTNMTAEAEKAVARCSESSPVIVPANSTSTLLLRPTPGLLKTFWLKWTSHQPDPLDELLFSRALVLRIFWDDATVPSIEAPLGDFFCNALRNRQFASLPIARLKDKSVCRFPMPFSKGMRMELRNDSSKPVKIHTGFDIASYPPSPPQRYFHATWRSSTAPGQPHSVMDARGPGHYAGCYLIEIGMDGGWNMFEGDEAILVDDNTRSYLGTGLEDYFNGGWYYYGLFDKPLSGLVDKSPIRSSQYRFHLTDPIRFEKNIIMNWEFGDGNRGKGYMSSVAYWYADSPQPAGSRIPALASRFPPADPLERHAIMCGLFELERIGRYDEALQRSLEYLAKFNSTPEAEVIALRALEYRQILEGYPAIKDALAALKNPSIPPLVKEQAETVEWFYQNPDRGILTANANGKYKLYWDGREVLEGNTPLHLDFCRIDSTAGRHQITAEVIAPDRPGPIWFRAHLRTAKGAFDTDKTWLVTLQKPADWPSVRTTEGDWKPAMIHGLPPFMNYWNFEPNAFVNAQAGSHFLYPKDEWKPGRTAYFKYEFDVK